MERKMNVPESDKKRIVIIGGGFAGIRLILKLKNSNYQIVLVDKHNYHTFQPLLYQVATAGLEADSIAYPLRKMFGKIDDFYFRMAEVNSIDTQKNCVYTNIGHLNFDYLVIASGSTNNFFGNEGFKKYSMPMKTVKEALDIRSLILQNLEEALLINDEVERKRLMNFVVVGAGPTGVELAGALVELKNHVLPVDYPDLDFTMMEVTLLEAGGQVLAGMSEASSKKAKKYLEKLGVKVMLNTPVEKYDGRYVTLSDSKLRARTLIWAAGVKGSIISGLPLESIERSRYLTNSFNQIEKTKNIYAVGDVALMKSEEYPNGHPQVAPVAIQHAEHLAQNFKRMLKNQPLKPFKYKDKGNMATIGRNKAVVDLHKIRFGGFLGWWIWMIVHLVSLVGFRNKAITLLNWVWNYVNYDRGKRLIIRKFTPVKNTEENLLV
jgi:NADH dehydrogenase